MRQMVGRQLWLLAHHMRSAVPIGHNACLLTEPILPFKATCASWLRGPSPIGLSSVRVSFSHTHICTTQNSFLSLLALQDCNSSLRTRRSKGMQGTLR